MTSWNYFFAEVRFVCFDAAWLLQSMKILKCLKICNSVIKIKNMVILTHLSPDKGNQLSILGKPSAAPQLE